MLLGDWFTRSEEMETEEKVGYVVVLRESSRLRSRLSPLISW